MTAYVELFIEQGSNLSSDLIINTGSSNSAANLTLSMFSARVKKSYNSSNLVTELVCSATDAANGVLNLSLPAANTANLTQGRYVYTVKMTNDSFVTRVIEGTLFVLPEV